MRKPRFTPKRVDDGDGGHGFDLDSARNWAKIALTIAGALGAGGGFTIGQLQAARDEAKHTAEVDMRIYNTEQKVEFLVQSQRIDHDAIASANTALARVEVGLAAVLRELESR